LAAAGLPAVPGIDWQMALASVDGQHARLHRRVRGFLEEYRNMPQTVRNAIASGQGELLQSLAHNLKSSAAYVGAATLATLAHQLEQALRDGQQAPISRLTLELVAQLELVLAGLAPVAAPAPASAAVPATHPALAPLLRQLHDYLRSDDARAEDLLQELRAALPGDAHAVTLTALAHAVDEIEYGVALGPLAELALALQITLEEENE
jgi:HPt (histidine-containing phosphotransfer) domain-containing protein